MIDYPSNSFKSKEKNQDVSEKKVEKVISGNVVTKKKSGMRKFTDVFVSEDVSNVKTYIFSDVLVPAVKSIITDIVTNSLDMILYGEGGSNRNKSGASKVSYRSYYDNNGSRRNYNESRPRQSAYDYDDVILDSRGEAEEVLSRMDEIVDRYDIVTVADFYDLVGLKSRHTDNKYGWTENIRNASVVRVRGGGYMIKFPTAKPID